MSSASSRGATRSCMTSTSRLARTTITWVTPRAKSSRTSWARDGRMRAAGSPRGTVDDRIWNGADDDGSGTASLLSMAKAFVTGPKLKRSLLFVWHAGEEKGLLGSRYFVDYPTVPLEKIVTQLNI